MLLVRIAYKPERIPRFGRVLPETPDLVELLDGDPLAGPTEPTGETLAYTPDEWQADPDGSDVELLCPVVPQKIIGVGSNYRLHAKEMGKPIPAEPLLFLKPPSALLAPGRAIERPGEFERCDYEGELAVVIGRRLHRQPPSAIPSFILGYSVLNDVTVRDLQKKDVQFTRAKGFDTFCPLGPAIATHFDVQALKLTTRLNGKVVQDSTGDQLIFSVNEVLSFISQVMTLEPGDVITTGTPMGVGNLKPGDLVSVTIDGIGTLSNPVVAGPSLPKLPERASG